MLYNHNRLIQAVEEIKKARGATYQEIAYALDLTPSFFSQVRAGKKKFSYENFMLFCKTFNIDPVTLQSEDAGDEVVTFQIGNAIQHWINARNYSLAKLSDKAGIGVFDLHDIISNVKKPTQEQLDRIAKVIEVDPKVFQPNYAEEFARLKKSLKDGFHLPNDKISAILDFIEHSL